MAGDYPGVATVQRRQSARCPRSHRASQERYARKPSAARSGADLDAADAVLASARRGRRISTAPSRSRSSLPGGGMTGTAQVPFEAQVALPQRRKADRCCPFPVTPARKGRRSMRA